MKISKRKAHRAPVNPVKKQSIPFMFLDELPSVFGDAFHSSLSISELLNRAKSEKSNKVHTMQTQALIKRKRKKPFFIIWEVDASGKRMKKAPKKFLPAQVTRHQ